MRKLHSRRPMARRTRRKRKSLSMPYFVSRWFKRNRKTLLRPVVLLNAFLVLAIVAVASVALYDPAPYTAVMLVNSKACGCMKNKCNYMQATMKDWVESSFKGRMRLKEVDGADPGRLRRYQEKYQAGMPPYLLVLKDGAAVYQSPGTQIDKQKLWQLMEKQ